MKAPLRRGLAAALVVLAACGPATDGAPIAFDLVVSRAIGDIGAFQIAVVTNGSSLNCTDVQRTCLSSLALPADRFVLTQDAQGVVRRAVTFPVNLKAGVPNTQEVKLSGVTPGKDYAVIIEAITGDAPPRLAGSSCNYLPDLGAGQNATLIAATIVPPATPVACDPSL